MHVYPQIQQIEEYVTKETLKSKDHGPASTTSAAPETISADVNPKLASSSMTTAKPNVKTLFSKIDLELLKLQQSARLYAHQQPER